MTRLMGRRAVAYVEGVEIRGGDMSFKCEKSLGKHPNTLELDIWNLSDGTVAKVQQKFATVLLLAGYEDSVSQLFKGEARSIISPKADSDRVTKIRCGDAEAAFGYGRSAQSFAPGSSVIDVVKGLTKSAGIGIGNAVEQMKKGNVQGGIQAFADGFTATGRTSDELDGVIRSAGFTWSIQDGELQLLLAEGDAINSPATAEVITGTTGMVGSPEVGSNSKQGGGHLLRVKCLMRPHLRCGSIIQVESDALPHGQFRAEKVTHEGNTAGGDWYTTIEARST